MSKKAPPKSAAGRAIRFLLENSLFLILGAVGGLLWANLDNASYEALKHLPIIENPWVGEAHHDDGHGGHGGDGHAGEAHAATAHAADAQTAEGHGGGHDAVAGHEGEEGHGSRVITLHYLVNDILMALFFAIAGKEVWEATLPGGPLSQPRKAATPLIATLGGVLVPAGVYLLGAGLVGQWAELASGWAIPCATDIAFSYMMARLVFGAAHPAIPFLLLLAIADDAIGLIIIAVFYPQEEPQLAFLLLSLAGMLVCWAFRRMRVASFWPYLLIGGFLSWIGFALSGLHPVLGLIPIIPMMPHAHSDTGLFDWSQLHREDTLTHFEHWWKNPVELILFAFGLLNAGVVVDVGAMFGPAGMATWLVLAGLMIGKPLGVWMFSMISKGLGFEVPGNMKAGELVVVGCAAAIGFTVALFVSTVAFPPGGVQDAAKMGALLSFAAAILTWVVAKLVRVRKIESTA